MRKTIVKALEGFEKQFDELNEMRVGLSAEKEVAIAEAIAEVERKFEARETKISQVLEMVSCTEEIEVPDEEIVDGTETVEAQEVY